MLSFDTVNLALSLILTAVIHCISQAGMGQLWGATRGNGTQIPGAIFFAIIFAVVSTGVTVGLWTGPLATSSGHEGLTALLLVWFAIINVVCGWGSALLSYTRMRHIRSIVQEIKDAG